MISTGAPKKCGIGCETVCFAKRDGCASECPSLQWRQYIEHLATIKKLESKIKDQGLSEVQATIFWTSILAFAVAEGQVMVEGNSGEFSCEENAKIAEENLKNATDLLIDVFAKNTGWKPVLSEALEENDYIQIWSLKKVNEDSSEKAEA